MNPLVKELLKAHLIGAASTTGLLTGLTVYGYALTKVEEIKKRKKAIDQQS